MKFGFKNAMHSFGSGITGVITQPIEESKKGGVLGFFKGTAKGMAGLVVKPVSGTLDFFSMTTEGIKNTSKNEEELALDRRLRLPRAFYEKEKIIREYDEFHAFLINLVPKLKNEISCDCFFDACLVDC
jgi:vacuolar protein sorting-associated protein 13A/C